MNAQLPYQVLPAKVQAAQQYLMFAVSKQHAGCQEGIPSDLIELETLEKMVYDSALKVMHDYFTDKVEYHQTAAMVPFGIPPVAPAEQPVGETAS